MPVPSLPAIPHEDWYETIPMSHGVTLIHEPWMTPFYRCNMWHVRGRDRDMLVDTGLGAVSLTRALPWLLERPIVCVSSHTHFDHIGSTHEFGDRLVHPAEAHILEDPRPEWTLWASYGADPGSDLQIFTGLPAGWDRERYRIEPAPATGHLRHGDVVDLGDRRFRVIHPPGHSPGGIALFEEDTGVLIAGDILYDGPLVTDTFHSDLGDYRRTLASMRDLPVSVVHGGHFPSFGRHRFRALIDGFLASPA
jgi:glyoxylase-like metal-dependent hydrolase (beta-lactamase superfamily II)